ncbi:MAG: hypothetical protein M1820_002867 [Bogoriella megaspora]|nr:MAG: hypothetical protein M1820_002867 [Bogoriella megaspora]
MAPNLGRLQEILGYQFADSSLLQAALQAAGANVQVTGIRRPSLEGNRGLALVGDTVLRTIHVEECIRKGLTREKTTNLISKADSNANLNDVGRGLDLHRFVITHPTPGSSVAPKTMADTMEALIGAAFLDGDIGAARIVIEHLSLSPVVKEEKT